MGSLKGGKSSHTSTKKYITPPPQVPLSLKVDVGLGFNAIDWSTSVDTSTDSASNDGSVKLDDRPVQSQEYNRRADGQRSMSYHTRSSPPSTFSSPVASALVSPSSASIAATSSYQAALGNALIVASHAESSKGTHSDLLQILNHDQQPWGFSYASYPHRVRVWYGDRDEKIAENAVRWMERNMGEGRCEVKVVRGADHGLMYRSSVVVEVLERVRHSWADNV